MKTLALQAIRLYQRFVSPHKGFGCAYRALTGRAGCSGLGYRAIRRYGVWRGAAVARARLKKCGLAYRRHVVIRTLSMRQAGFCDVPSCDLPSCDFASVGGDVLSGAGDACGACGFGDCGNLRFSRNRDREEKWIHVNPQPRRGEEAPPEQQN
jgi:putative component of membrane protein insertase Oxa1/YidC/SpoIIIJ protein YidD